jgi:dolichol-phosphate mannosyltransferase
MFFFIKNKISIIIPTLNEAKNIIRIIKKLLYVLKKRKLEIIIVDDNSSDGTARLILENFSNNSKVKLVQKKGGVNLIESLKLGIQVSDGEYCAVMDGDGQHSSDDMTKMLSLVKKNDLVIGCRNIKKIKFLSDFRVKMSLFFNKLIFYTSKIEISDPLTGFFIFKKKIIGKRFFSLKTSGFKVLLDLIYTLNNNKIKIHEFQINFEERKRGISKLNPSVIFSFITQLISLNFYSLISPQFIGFLVVGFFGMFLYFISFYFFFSILQLTYFYAYLLSSIITVNLNFFLNIYLSILILNRVKINYFFSLLKYYLLNIPGLIIGVNLAIYLNNNFNLNIYFITFIAISFDAWFKYYFLKTWIFK